MPYASYGTGIVTDPLKHLEAAIALSKRINDKVDDLFAPLEREMKIMRWPAQYQSILWEAVILGAKERMEKLDE